VDRAGLPGREVALFGRLPELKPAELPAFPGWRGMLGPGVVWMALAQGSGELIFWPYVVAKYGLGLLFLLVPGCLLQWPLSYEIGRYTALTGESIWRGFYRLHPWFAFPLWLLMGVSFLWFGAFASAGGTALAALTQFPAGWTPRGQSLFWAYAAIAVFAGGLALSRVVYAFIEKFMWAVAVTTFVGLAAACTHPAVLEKVPEFLAGLAVPERPMSRPWDPKDASPLLTAMTFAGLGGFWMLFYSYWLREKGAGMGGYSARMTGVLRGKDEPSGVRAGPVLSDGEGLAPAGGAEAAGRWASWKRFLRFDSGVGLFGNLVTTLMTCLLAYALLTPRGLLPEGWNVAVVQAEFFGLRWGELGRWVFLLVAAAFLSDTWLSTVDGVSRVDADMVRCLFPAARRKSERWWYYFFVWTFTAVTCATMPLAQPGPLLVFSAVIGFWGMVLYSGALYALNHVYLPPRLPDFARPGRLSRGLLAACCAAYLGFAAAYIRLEFF
jgi:hypothetical protein